MGSHYWNFVSICFCFELVKCSFTLENHTVTSGGISPTNDINTTVALALLTSVAYFYAGLSKKGLGYFGKYIQPTPILLPINILEDFTKPLSLSFRLFRNILAGELVVLVLVSLVPSVVPIPIMLLGLYRRIHGGSLLTSFQNSLFFQFKPYTIYVHIKIICLRSIIYKNK